MTLPIDTAQGQTNSYADKLISEVVAHLVDTRGVWVGTAEPDGDDPLENLNELKVRDDEEMGEPIKLSTDKKVIGVESRWDKNGQVLIRQVDPLPMTIAAIHPSGEFGFTEASNG
jgi:hypothetical protein